MLTSWLASARAAKAAPIQPRSTPAATGIAAWLTIKRSTLMREAPSARRMPISAVRCVVK